MGLVGDRGRTWGWLSYQKWHGNGLTVLAELVLGRIVLLRLPIGVGVGVMMRMG